MAIIFYFIFFLAYTNQLLSRLTREVLRRLQERERTST